MSGTKKKCFKSSDNRVRKEISKYWNLIIREGFTEEEAVELCLEGWTDWSRKSVSYGYRKRECGMRTKHKAGMHKTGDSKFTVLNRMEVQCGEY